MTAVLVPLFAAALAALVQHGFYVWLFRRPAHELRLSNQAFVRGLALGFVAKIFFSVALVIGYALVGLPNPAVFMLTYAGVFAGLAMVESLVRTRRLARGAGRVSGSRGDSRPDERTER